MTITLTWNDFKTMNPYQGAQVVFVKDVNNDVLKALVLPPERGGLLFVFTNPPSKANFLDIYPGATSVNDLV